MAITSAVSYIRETLRQQATEDSDYYKRILHFFELHVPASVGALGQTTFLFPLILPPQSYSFEEPFMVSLTETQGGGLWAEENGMVRRVIHLRGNTGFKPRPLKLMYQNAQPVDLSPDKKSYSRMLPSMVLDSISGQRHFQYLQDSVFRTYADLKADPATAKDTRLIYHNPQDQEHWVVVPSRFTLSRDKGSPLIYNYDIELFAVEKAEAVSADFSEDQSIFEAVKDGLRMIKKGIDLCQGALNDLIALEGFLMSYVSNIDTLISAAQGFLTNALDYVEGRIELIEATYDYVADHLTDWENAAGTISAYMEANAGDKTIPDEVLQKVRKMSDGFALILTNPAAFEQPTEAAVRRARENQEFRRSISFARSAEALASETPASFDAVRTRGTSLTPGDVQIGDGDILAGSEIPVYHNARQVTIGADDTLPSLAAKYLGSSRLWQYLAIFNDLKPPYIDHQAGSALVAGVGTGSIGSGGASGSQERPFTGVLGVGSKILIPSNLRSVQDMGTLPVLGVRAELSAEEQALGTDFALEAVEGLAGSSRALYDIPIDTELGSTDAKLVRGLSNLEQAIQMRLLTEQGTDLMYRNLGVKRLVGLGSTVVDFELARFRISQAISADPRILSVRSIQLAQESDLLEVDLVAEIRGFQETQTVHTTL